MLFRIENTVDLDGRHRKYALTYEELPQMLLFDLEAYIANEVRKEINNAKNRTLLSYSKSLGVCLLKYNEYADNELHISNMPLNYLYFFDCKKWRARVIEYDMYYGLPQYIYNSSNRKIILLNFSLDTSNNYQVNSYLKYYTGKGKKAFASPEKDYEVLIMQSPQDLVISQYIDSIYLLYALVYRYGMNQDIFFELYNMINMLPDYSFSFCNETERDGILEIVQYLYYYGNYERKLSEKVFLQSQRKERFSIYYDPILQLHGIQAEDFYESYMLRDYNANVVSDCIWDCYWKYNKRW